MSFCIRRWVRTTERLTKAARNWAGNLASLLRDVLMRSGVRRAIVAGGDTSSHSVRQLGIEALTFAGLHHAGRAAVPMSRSRECA